MSSSPRRMMCSCGSHMWLSVRNGWVKISSPVFNITESAGSLFIFIMISSGFHSLGHQRPDQQGVLSHAGNPPRQTRYRGWFLKCFEVSVIPYTVAFQCNNTHFGNEQSRLQIQMNFSLFSLVDYGCQEWAGGQKFLWKCQTPVSESSPLPPKQQEGVPGGKRSK